MNSRTPVVPMSFRISPSSSTPGSSTEMRSEPCVTTMGSETPVALTRLSTISRVFSRMSAVTGWSSVATTWYSPRRPPMRSRPRRVSSAWPSLPPGRGSGKTATRRATTNTASTMKGSARCIGRDVTRERPRALGRRLRTDAARSAVEMGSDALRRRPADARHGGDLLHCGALQDTARSEDAE